MAGCLGNTCNQEGRLNLICKSIKLEVKRQNVKSVDQISPFDHLAALTNLLNIHDINISKKYWVKGCRGCSIPITLHDRLTRFPS
jgi:hypothetical protein